MSSCNNSTDATVNMIITTVLATAIIRYVEPQLQSTTFANTLWEVTKIVIKNDKQALPDAIRAIRCWLEI